jgi:SulP family sulfate permease
MPPITPRKQSYLTKFIPILGWLRHYPKQDFNSDVFAGFITAILFVPQGIAYAILAGLPAQVGLYASVLPPLVYAFLGTSRTLSVGPVSIAAIMIASALSAPELQQFGSPVEHAVILAAEGGIIMLLMAAFHMGSLVKFISHPVLSGFTSGASILIIFSQLPHLFGVDVKSCGSDLNCIVENAFDFNIYATALGLMSLAILILMGKPLTKWLSSKNLGKALVTGISRTAPLLVVIITTVIVSYYHLADTQSVTTVGQIPSGLPDLQIFGLFSNSEHWLALLPSAIFISVIAYVESVAIALVTANLRNQRIDTNQELIALGGANLATAISGGMTVAGGFSRTMVNFSAGARTQLAMIIAVVLLSLALVFSTEYFTDIPKATLAAIILVAIMPLIKLKEIAHTFQFDRGDAITQLITLVSVLVLGIEEGIALGVLVTFMVYLRRTSLPHTAVVGRVPGTQSFRNVDRYTVETWPELLMFRVDENITFANIGFITDQILEKVDQQHSTRHLVLICSSVSHIDMTAYEAILTLILSLKNREVTLHLAEVKGPVMDKLNTMDFEQELGEGKIFFHTHDAVKELVSA